MKLYMAVTADKYELPLCVGTAREVAAFAGVNLDNFYSQITKTAQGKATGKLSGRKLIKVEID